MTERLGVGFSLHPDLEYLELTRDIIENDADYYEVNPETLWRQEGDRLVRNGFHNLYRQFRDRSRKPFVAHGLGFSLGTPVDAPGEPERIAAWMERLRDDHSEFRFPWISDHLGWQIAEGIQANLPLPLPFTAECVEVVASRMRLLASVTGLAAFENNVSYFSLSDSAGEPEFFNAICRAAPCRMMLDLHNVYTQGVNDGLDPADYVDRLDLGAVVQIHLSGGAQSDPAWVPQGRVFRLDSHDGPIPEEVWSLLERVLPKCSGLRGIVVERLNATFTAADVPALADEVRRAKRLFKC